MTTPIPAADDAVVVRAADAETLGHPALLTINLLADSSDTDHALSAVRVTLAQGVDGATPHHHTGRAELFFVIDGRLEVLLGEEVVSAGAGDLVVVPHHLPHAFGAAPGSMADVLIIFAPGLDRFEYFRTLERVAYGKESADVLQQIQEQFDNWYLDSPAWQRARSGAAS